MSMGNALTIRAAALGALAGAYGLFGASAAFAGPQGWGSSMPLQGGLGCAPYGGVTIDDAGDAATAWQACSGGALNPIHTDFRPAGAKWQPPQQIPATPPQAFDAAQAPIVRGTASGLVTAVWLSRTGVWTADKLPGQNWGAPQNIGAAFPQGSLFPALSFAMNRRGDAVASWAAVPPNQGANTVYSSARQAGGAWAAAPDVVSSGHVAPADVAVGAGGAAVIAWQSFDISGSGGDYFRTNLKLYGASTASPGAVWQNSALLAGAFAPLVAVDAAGQAVIVGQASNATYVSFGNSGPGAPWTGPVTLSAPAKSAFSATQLKTDDAGDVTFVYAGTDDYHLFETRGTIAGNRWNAPGLVFSSGRRPIYGSLLDVAADGRALLATAPSQYLVEAQTRVGPSSAWSASATLHTSTSTVPVDLMGAAINPAGQAVVTWSAAFNTYQVFANSKR